MIIAKVVRRPLLRVYECLPTERGSLKVLYMSRLVLSKVFLSTKDFWVPGRVVDNAAYLFAVSMARVMSPFSQ